jgi:membrane-bound ClpP family serine protease
MSWTDWSLLGIFILGFVLFLIGANTYNAIIGYAGIYLFIGSVAAYLIIYIYKELKKKPAATDPASAPSCSESIETDTLSLHDALPISAVFFV